MSIKLKKMSSKVALKNNINTEFSIQYQDGKGVATDDVYTLW